MIHRIPFVLALAALTAIPALALSHAGPQATDSASDGFDAAGWTPKPTPAPRLSGTLSELKNRKRQSNSALVTNTCGWYSADPTEPFSCLVGQACMFNTVGSYFGCCSTNAGGYLDSSDCNYIANPATACFDYTDASRCTGQCAYTNIVCDTTSPYCGSALLFLTDFQVLTYYACLTGSEFRVFSVDPTTKGISSQTITTSNSVNSTPSTSATVTSISPTNTIGTQPKSSHAGAIASGVIGGLAILAAAAVGGVLLLRNKKKNQRKSIMPEVSQM